MSGVRVEWGELPEAVRESVVRLTGAVVGVESVAAGITCHVAAVLTDSAGVRTFVKGVRGTDVAGCRGQECEAAVNPGVLGVGPLLRWRCAAGGWELLGFEAVAGRHADVGPESRDLALVADTLRVARWCRVPDGVGLPSLAERYAERLRPGDAGLLSGGVLLHTDTNPHNVLVSGRRGWLVDWALAATGPAWVDMLQTAVYMVAFETPVRAARAWLAGFPEWADADPRAVDAYVHAVCADATARFGAAADGSNQRLHALVG